MAKRDKDVVETEAGRFPVLRMTRDGFVIAADGAPPTLGRIRVLRNGDVHATGLAVLTARDSVAVTYEFKRLTRVPAVPILDAMADDFSPLATRLP